MSGQDPARTPHSYRQQAAHYRLQALLYEASAESARHGYDDIGGVGIDLGIHLSLRLQECARELRWAATQLDLYAVEAEERVDDVGRLDEERPPNFAVVAGGTP